MRLGGEVDHRGHQNEVDQHLAEQEPVTRQNSASEDHPCAMCGKRERHDHGDGDRKRCLRP